jgi:hypothetical protein
LITIRFEDIEKLFEFAKASQVISQAAHSHTRLLNPARPGTAARRALGAFAIIEPSISPILSIHRLCVQHAQKSGALPMRR